MMHRPLQTVSGLIVHERRVLLLQRKERISYGLWCLPGGKIEMGESPSAALDRELNEEIGISVQEKRCLLYLYHEKKGIEMHVYHILSYDGTLSNPEHHRWTWAHQAHLHAYPSYFLNQRIAEYILAHPLSDSISSLAYERSPMFATCDGW